MINNFHANSELERLKAIRLARRKRMKKSDNSIACASSVDVLGNFVPKLNPYKAPLSELIAESNADPIRRSNLTGAIMGMVDGYDYETGNFKK